MKKTLIAFLGLLILVHGIPFRLCAQHESYTFGRHIMFECTSIDTRFMVRQPASYAANVDNVNEFLDYLDPLSKIHGLDADRKPKTPIMLGVMLNANLKDYVSSYVKTFSKTETAYLITDSSEAGLLALGINPDNAKDYIYHVVEDDSIELVHWTPVTKMEQKHGAKKPYAFLGAYKAPGHQIMVEVVNTKDYSIRDGAIFEWRLDYKPRIEQLVIMKARNIYFNINFAKLNCGYATRFDSLTDLPTDLHFPVDSVEWLIMTFKRHEVIPYSMYLLKNIGGKPDTVTVEYINNEDNFLFDKRWFDKPGKYELLIHRAADIHEIKEPDLLRLKFEVLPPPLIDKKVSVKQLLPYILGAIALISIAFAAYFRYNKRKLKKAAAHSEAVNLQLRSIHSQLNPHFMFNALAAIQGLMNKNDVGGANHYLAKFADLTRQVLQSGEEEMISLEDEWKLLDNYLQMEQLRFGFTYSLKADSAINLANTEIPVMLLQPFVENAVKHGVAAKHQEGKIDISVQQWEQSLILTVRDNGKGFGATTAPAGTDSPIGTGLGLKLSGQRIVLLNQRYKAPRISLKVDSNGSGTIVTIQLDQWI